MRRFLRSRISDRGQRRLDGRGVIVCREGEGMAAQEKGEENDGSDKETSGLHFLG